MALVGLLSSGAAGSAQASATLEQLVAVATSWPVAALSGLVGLVFVYWVLVLSGLLDPSAGGDWLEAGAAGVEGAVEGAVDGALEGASAAAAGDSISLEEAARLRDPGSGILSLRGVPSSLSFSFWIVYAWLFALGVAWLFGMVADPAPGAADSASPSAMVRWAAGGGGVLLGFVAAAITLLPLRKLLDHPTAVGRRELIGRLCTVTTQRVDAGFGQGEIVDDGAAILVQLRCDETNVLTRGDEALVIDYDADAEVFWVVPTESAPRRAMAASGDR
ncbi:MAG: hypothetical protein AAF772_10920 [Acidobacteriota bacterium]